MSSVNNMSSRQSTWKTLSTYAKAHHESLNAAYATYYSGGVTPRSSMDSQSQSRNASTSTAYSQSSERNVTKAWKSLKKHAKKHHESLNAAYSTYYGAGASPSPSARSSPAASPRDSLESQRSEVSVQSESNASKAWKSLKKHAREHHRGMNAAYAAYYGATTRA